MSHDQRKSYRVQVKLFVEYVGAVDRVGDYTENLSLGGTFVVTNRELPIGTDVHLVLSSPGLLEPISIEGTVRWTRSGPHTEVVAQGEEAAGAGIQFMAGPACEELAGLIEKIRERDPKTVNLSS